MAATLLAGAYADAGPGDAGIRPVRVVAYALYCLGSASTAFAFLGFFLRYFDRPSRAWRYLADTALWVYLVHQPLVLIGLALCTAASACPGGRRRPLVVDRERGASPCCSTRRSSGRRRWSDGSGRADRRGPRAKVAVGSTG